MLLYGPVDRRVERYRIPAGSSVIAPEIPSLVSANVPVMPVISSKPGVEVGETVKVPELVMLLPLNEKLIPSAQAGRHPMERARDSSSSQTASRHSNPYWLARRPRSAARGQAREGSYLFLTATTPKSTF